MQTGFQKQDQNIFGKIIPDPRDCGLSRLSEFPVPLFPNTVILFMNRFFGLPARLVLWRIESSGLDKGIPMSTPRCGAVPAVSGSYSGAETGPPDCGQFDESKPEK